MTDPLALKMALGKHAHVKPLKDGSVRSPRLTIEQLEFDPLPKAFRTMVRGGDIDVGEMALTTHLLAVDLGKPITALAIPLWRRLHHSNLVCATGSDVRGPKDLVGRKVGVRAWSQTTGVWIRGILKTEYGVDHADIDWITMEDAHVDGYQDPSNVTRARPGETLRSMLLSGEIAAIMGERTVDPSGVRPVIADAETAEKAWSERTGIFPVNHVVAVKNELLAAHPWLAEELKRLFEEARVASGTGFPPYGLEENRAPMQMLLDFALDQKLVTRRYTVDELFPLS